MFLSVTLGNIKENLTISICGNPISQKSNSTSNIKCYFVFINGDAIQDVAFHNIVVMRSISMGSVNNFFVFQANLISLKKLRIQRWTGPTLESNCLNENK